MLYIKKCAFCLHYCLLVSHFSSLRLVCTVERLGVYQYFTSPWKLLVSMVNTISLGCWVRRVSIEHNSLCELSGWENVPKKEIAIIFPRLKTFCFLLKHGTSLRTEKFGLGRLCTLDYWTFMGFSLGLRLPSAEMYAWHHRIRNSPLTALPSRTWMHFSFFRIFIL